MKMFYSIGEVAELLDIPTSTVRFWEKSFDILRPQKSSAGHRKFTNADIENLKTIYHLVKEKGMTLEGARQRLRENPAGISHDREIMDRLLGIRALLQEIREELGNIPAQGGYYVSAPDTSEEKSGIEEHESMLADSGSSMLNNDTPVYESDPVTDNKIDTPTIIEQTLF